MTDTFRALCAELTDDLEEWVDGYLINDPADEHTAASLERINRARALLAEPVAEGPTTADLRQVFDDQSGYIDDEQVMWAGDFYKAARAVLARYGHQPAPPAEGEVKG